METKNSEMEENFTSRLSNSVNLTKENELTKSSESRNSTKSLLEGICSDFESIEVISPSQVSRANESSTSSFKVTSGPSTSKENYISNHLDSNSTLQESSNALLASSLAQVADAEIVQTGDNQVSIVITNPRMIQVLQSDDGKHQYSSVSQSVAESVVVEETPDLAFQSEISSVAKDIVYDGHLREASPKKKKYHRYTPITKGKAKVPVYKPKTDMG